MRKITAPAFLLFSLPVILFLSSCGSTKRLRYFQDLPESHTASELALAAYTEPHIQPDDILSIHINTIDADATAAINARNVGYTNMGAQAQGATPQAAGTGYLVDKDGYVDIPIVGRLKVGGLTTAEARDAIKAKSASSFKNPVVDVRYANFKITVIGEVSRPATYVLPNEQVTLLDAIGYAGDLTIYGKRENILVIRKDANGKNFTVKLDLTQKSTLNSPYFYLKQNDVVYVEPNKTKVLNNDNNVIKYITAAATIFTAIVLGIRYL
ncbi:MAG: polysaccharide biosynthesis/export family protein [Mucilaginibacter sp.]|nr:polysaccharide biosynthesis/export family protein [Mucilaginibacter sp.]